jgi:methionine-rich copper-binding protein CopC
VTLVVSPSVALSTLSWSSASELTVSPVSALGFSTTYTVTVSGDDLAGNALAAPATFSFTTGGPPDTTPPTLQSSTPTGGAVGVTKATRLSITFSEQMSPATVSVDVNPSLELGTEAWGNENRTISFPSPADDWAFSTTYTVTVMGSDVAGNPMTESTITFTTETPPDTTRPTIVSAAPGAGALNVPVNTNLEFTFSEPMDQAATEAAFSSTPAVTCVFTWNTRRTLMSCNPSVNLSFGTAYMARIGTGARDDAGNALAVQFQAAFTTAAAPDTTHPTVTATTPTSGQVGVSRYGNVIVTFSEPMRQGATVAAFQFTSPAAHPFTYGWNPAGTVLTINPATDFVYGQLVTFTIGTGAEDLAGNALQSSVTRSFRVKRQTTQRFYFSGTTNTGVIAQPEGFIRGTASCSTASVYHSSTYGAAGDSYSTTSPNNSAYRGFVTFNIGSLSALTGVSILSASATLQQGGCVGDPFSPAFGGAVVLEHVDIGATLGLEDCGAPNLGGRRAVLSTTSGSGLKTALVTTAVRDDFTNVSARGGRSQFRIQTSTLTQSDGDMVSDYCTYWTSNVSGTATDPYLTITYEYD